MKPRVDTEAFQRETRKIFRTSPFHVRETPFLVEATTKRVLFEHYPTSMVFKHVWYPARRVSAPSSEESAPPLEKPFAPPLNDTEYKKRT